MVYSVVGYVFLELVVFVVVMVCWWLWSSCGGDGCLKGGYSNCFRIAILKCILGGCGCGASGGGGVWWWWGWWLWYVVRGHGGGIVVVA